jgi:pimeloyl-ACP methyl ester carboxylesterase
VILVAAVAAAAFPSSGAAAAAWSPCPDRPEVDCVRVTVPLDRLQPAAGSLALHVERWAARPSRGVLLLLAGGPGQSSTRAFDVGNPYWRDMFPGYTLAAFDPRGTGRSGALSCPELDPRLPPGPEPPVALCARRLGATRALYGTDATVHDLDAVRDALGAPTVALAGVSYGTRVALAYAVAYPGRTERLVLDSVVPLRAPHPFASPTLRAIPAAARALCAGGACAGVTRDLAADIATVANRLGDGSMRGTVRDTAGRARRVELWGTELLSLVIRADSEAGIRAELPAAIRDAARGRPRALLRLWHALKSTEPPPEPDVFSMGVLAAALCSDGSFPWPVGATESDRRAALGAAARALPAGALGPFGSWATAFGTAAFCLPWPEAGARTAPPPLPDVPALVFAGDVDMRTPVADARALASTLPRARFVVARGTGHAVLFSRAADCARRAIAAWLGGGAPATVCARRAAPLATVSLPLRTFAELARGRGAAGRRARTLAGVRRTVVEARAAFHVALVQSRWGAYAAPVPGLVGGSLTPTSAAGSVELRRYAFVPGLSLSGTLAVEGDPADARLVGGLRVCGARATPGVVVLDAAGRLRGVVGGRAVGAGGPVPAVPRCR